MAEKVAIFSLMRNRASKIQEYRDRVNSFNYKNISINVCEGDSDDETYSMLKHWEAEDPRVKIFKLDLNKPFFGSVVDPERFFILGTCNDFMLNEIVKDQEVSHALYLQPDLITQPDLIDRLMANDKDVVAGMVWGAHIDGTFYDTWGYRSKDSGCGWGQFDRTWYHQNVVKGLVEVNNVGSCFLVKRCVLDAGARFGTIEDVVAFTNAARACGFSIWVDTTIDIVHPPN